ncbi:hypothetical protein ACFXPZ_32700 [Streptomyces sp. NPDC059101]|uniref:hypothetical protein n=1 Tax=unclassified Streptomyces TaxID=2593676 RepID=UPI00367D904A
MVKVLVLHVHGDRPVGVEEAGGGGGGFGEVAEVDGFGGQRAALVEAGEEEQVLDHGVHPGGFALDALHGASEEFGVVSQAMEVERSWWTPPGLRPEHRGPYWVRSLARPGPAPSR